MGGSDNPQVDLLIDDPNAKEIKRKSLAGCKNGWGGELMENYACEIIRLPHVEEIWYQTFGRCTSLKIVYLIECTKIGK